jgi:Lar family restriction alleviation protein
MKRKLKPCPFCGGKAKLKLTPNLRHFYVRCENGDVEQLLLHVTKAEAIEAWNRRLK